ncbi:MAG: SH3 domain-containing protein [Burkholderiaceae bacterium]
MRRAPAQHLAAACAAVLCLAGAAAATAAEFRGVAGSAAILYDGPSERARKLFIVVQGTPLEIISTINQWVKVRDQSGDVLWIARADLGESRHVVANTLASIRRSPQTTGELVVQVDRGVLLEVVDAQAAPGWLRVRHADGAAGFVAAAEIWGR